MNFIVAVEENWGIGKNNDLLFRLPPDMAYFKEKTMGKVVVMGEATLKSLPGSKGLPGRTNVVLSDNPGFSCENVVLCRSMAELFDVLSNYNSEDIFVIGGASVYNQLMDCCDTAYITKVQRSVPHDVSIHSLDGRDGWQIKETSEMMDYKGLQFTFNVYQNTKVRAFAP